MNSISLFRASDDCNSSDKVVRRIEIMSVSVCVGPWLKIILSLSPLPLIEEDSEVYSGKSSGAISLRHGYNPSFSERMGSFAGQSIPMSGSDHKTPFSQSGA